MTLLSFKIYSRIVIRLKAIEYKIDIACYLSFLPSDLIIKPGFQAH